MGAFSLSHILILVIIFIVFFRPRQVGAAAKGLGQFWRNLKNEMNTIEIQAKDVSQTSDHLSDKLSDKKAKSSEKPQSKQDF